MKKIVLILIVLINSIKMYAQVGRLDTLTENKRNEIILKAVRDRLEKETHLLEYYNAEQTPIILDLGVWQKGDTVKLNIGNHEPLIGRQLYAVVYPASEEDLKYYPYVKNKMVIIFDAKKGESIYRNFGMSKTAVRNMKEYRHRKDSLNLLRLKYLEKEKRLKEIEDSISRDNGGRSI